MAENLNLKQVETVDTRPFRKLVMTIGELPTSFIESMTYYELLAWFTNYLETVIIPTVNNNGEAVEELQEKYIELKATTEQEIDEFENEITTAFNTLKNFVDTYFENLDVQEEINNKLDQMVEDGTLEDVLLNYATVSKVYSTTRDMIQDASNLLVGEKVRTLGYYNLNDGGGSEFIITSASSDKYQITLGTNKYALMIATNVNVDQLGANGGNKALSEYFGTLEEAQNVYSNATDLNQLIGGVAIQCSVIYFHNYKISLSANTYYASENLGNETYNRIYLSGNEKWKSVIKRVGVPDSEASIIRLNSYASRCIIENIDFVGPYEATDTEQTTLSSYIVNGIFMDHSSYNTIKNCSFRLCRSGIKTSYSWTNLLQDCYFVRCNYGIGLEGSAQNCTEINHCFVEYCNYGMLLGEGRSQLIINCNIEHCNNDGIRKTNEGDVQIISCYFESNINVFYGQTYVRNILVSGCSFYQNSTNSSFYSPIVFTGNANGHTQITIQNCNFIDANSTDDYSNHPAIMQLNNAVTIPPVLINNTITNMIEFRPVYMRGVHIKNGVVKSYIHRSFAQNNINASDGGNKLLDYNDLLDFRLNLMASGTYSIKIPSVLNDDSFTPHQFRIIVGPNNTSSNTGTVSLIPNDSSTCEVSGHTSISINDKNKLITINYLGNWSSKDHWVASITS